MREGMTHSVPIELRFSDLDAYGHVNNATYFSLLETARTKLFLGKFSEYMAQALHFLVVKAECEYKLPIELQDQLVISLQIDRIGSTSFDIAYRLHNDGDKLFALAKTVMVCFDGKAKQPTRIPENLKQLMLQG